MNPDEPSPAAFNLDELKLLPDWMKADAPAPPGVGHGNMEERFRDRGGAPSRGDDRRPERGGGGRGPDRGPGGGGGQRFERRPSSGGDRDRDRRSGPPRRGGFDRDRDRGPRPPEPAPVFPARVRVEFVPDPRPLAGIAKEIRASHLAYPLFGLARMFLDRPERHRIRMSVEAPPRPPAAGGGEPAAPAPDMTVSGSHNGPAAPTTLFQLGEDGPIATDRAALERIAFDLYRERFYVEQRVQKDPPKGNFTGVARERSTGTLLGPTNYHAYQANLRALYESRFSRRMSFENFRRDVEVVNDPALVERWKEETRTVTTYGVRDTLPPEPAPTTETPPAAVETTAAPGDPPVEGETPEPAAEAAPEPTPPVEETAPAAATDAPAAEPEASAAAPEEAPAPDPAAVTAPPPTVLETLADARQHFREHYLESLVRARRSFEVPGPVGRQLPEASLTLALRLAHEQELKYPAGLVQPLRAGLQNNGLHIFKHRKRIVYVSAARPVPFRSGGEKGGAVSEQVSAILETVTAHPLINRKQLAERLLAKRFGSPGAHSLAPATPAAPPTETPTPAAAPAAPAAEAAGTESTATPHAAEEAVATTLPVVRDPQQEALVKAKASLAADLRYLVQAGHIIEFHNGGFDLPLLPKPPEAPRQKPPSPPAAAPTMAKQPPTPVATDDAKGEAVATPVPIEEREKAPETTEAPPVVTPPENDDIFAPPATATATTAPEEPAPPAAIARTDDPRPEEAVASSEPFDGPESLPPPPAGVEEKTATTSPDPTLPTGPTVQS